MRRDKGYKGLGMEGSIATWYAQAASTFAPWLISSGYTFSNVSPTLW